MTRTVALNKGNILSRIKVHLSIIGRRLNQKEGDKNYQKVTLTTNEDTLIDDCFTGACAYIAAQFPEVLVTYEDTQQEYDDKARSNDAQQSALSDVFSSYILSYCIGSYLAMNYPDLAKKYQQEAASYLLAARNIIYTKTEPKAANGSNLNAPTIN